MDVPQGWTGTETYTYVYGDLNRTNRLNYDYENLVR